MTAVDPKVLKILAHLQNRTVERGCTEAEQQEAANKTQELLLKHNIEMASVAAASAAETKSQGPRIQHVSIPMAQKKVQSFDWCLYLAGAVAFACTSSYLWNKEARQITFVGTETDIQVSTALYQFLVDQIEALSIKETWGIPDIAPGAPTDVIELAGREVTVPKGFRYWHNPGNRGGQNAIKFRRGFLFGCASRVSLRLREQARATRIALDGTGQVTALVAVKEGLVRSYVSETFTFGKAHRRQLLNVSNAGYSAGFTAGGKVALNKRPQLDK